MNDNLPGYIRAILNLALALFVLSNAYPRLKAYGVSHDGTAPFSIAGLVCGSIVPVSLAVRAIKADRKGGH